MSGVDWGTENIRDIDSRHDSLGRVSIFTLSSSSEGLPDLLAPIEGGRSVPELITF